MPDTRLFLIDSFSLIFRAYYANMKLKNGAAFTFTRMLLAILRQHAPSHIACVFDTSAPTFRHEMYPEYKANRSEMPEDLRPQIPLIKKLAQALNVKIVELPGFEADDVMGTLAVAAANSKIPVALVSPDKDLLQLVDDTSDIKVLKNNKDGDLWIDRAAVKENFGVWPEQVVDYLTLVGDSSDNVKGVPGIGEKGARALLETHSTLENLLASRENLKPKQRSGIEEATPWLYLTRTLVTIRTDLALPVGVNELAYSGWDVSAALAVFKELGFETLVKEYISEAPAPTAERRYTCAKSIRDVEAAVSECRKAGKFALDTETTSLEAARGHLVGISMAWRANEGFYIPLAHLVSSGGDEGALPGLFEEAGLPESLLDLNGCPDKFWEKLAPYLDSRNLPLPGVWNVLAPLFADSSVGKYGQNIKYDLQVLARHGLEVNGITHDSMVLSFVLGSANRHNLDDLSVKHLGIKPISFESVVGKGKAQLRFDQASFDQAVQYAAEDADLTLQLVEKLAPQLQDESLKRLYNEVDLPLVEVLADLESTGIRIDLGVLDKLSVQFNSEKAAAEAKIFELAGEIFNPASPAQLGRILYEKLGLPVIQRTTKTKAPSTDEDVLQELSKLEGGEIAQALLRYRQMSKLLGTYVEALPQLINPITGRVHTKLHQAAVATGRLASSEPNLQNIPIRTEEGRAIRGAFVPEPGWVLLDADYSQIELRVVAALAKDPILLGAFERGEDIHRRTASEVMGVAMEDVTPEQRGRAKAVNFGLLYGQGAFALSAALGISHSEAKAFIESYFERMPAVARWIDEAKAQAIKNGFVKTAWGRTRRIPELLSANTQFRNQGLREAVNTIVQGTAADIMRRAMVRLHRSLKGRNLKSRLLLQVHDELLLEAPMNEIAVATETLKTAMEGADDLGKLGVRLEAEVRSGASWLECK